MSNTNGTPNALIHEQSPYLQQHAYNPVEWQTWSDAALQRARDENKLLLVSIGYSSCHWCHVMERESFEDAQVAAFMNAHYICIKVDREERPDLDHKYMDACTLTTGRGGWPLNAMALPDGRAVYAGTYFPKNQWLGLLKELAIGYRKEPEKYVEYAEKLAKGVAGMQNLQTDPERVTAQDLKYAIANMEVHWDAEWGGRTGAPKFPMPDIWFFVEAYQSRFYPKYITDQVRKTLLGMASGGIYDALGGGFARYSTDEKWLVPHFEKMLYDNAQLIGLYSKYNTNGSDAGMMAVVAETIDWLKREMKDPSGGYYCALDADSEGVEGKYYIWTQEELDEILTTEEEKRNAKVYLGLGDGGAGYWHEMNAYIPCRVSPSGKLEQVWYIHKVARQPVEKKLLEARSKRERPGLDNKIICSWNALLLSGLCKAARYLIFRGEGKQYAKDAGELYQFLSTNMVSKEEEKVYRFLRKDGAHQEGFLDDYALLIQALLEFYEISAEAEALDTALWLMEVTMRKFDIPGQVMLAYSPTNGVVAENETPKIEYQDNVISSSNSTMCMNMIRLGNIVGNMEWIERARAMMQQIKTVCLEQGSYFSKWLMCMLIDLDDQYKVIVGPPRQTELREWEYLQHSDNAWYGYAYQDANSSIEALKPMEGDKKWRICQTGACGLPMSRSDVSDYMIEEIHGKKKKK